MSNLQLFRSEMEAKGRVHEVHGFGIVEPHQFATIPVLGAGGTTIPMAYLDPVRKEAPKIQPIAIGLFPGAVNFGRLSAMDKMMLKAKGVSEGDYRDWRRALFHALSDGEKPATARKRRPVQDALFTLPFMKD